ncbi:hypothetical protein FAVG1_09848 [Fusarium avenaceum]|nr:hypothetical protein FAVG1_09848 [Fusarium avenaceum]
MPDVKSSLLTQVTDLKDKNPNLNTMIAFGGWTHNDPGKYRTVFSDMVSTRVNRQLFIKNLLGFLCQYGFDSIDFNWEYHSVKDRGGKEADVKNFTQFLKELQAAMRSGGRHYLVIYTAPTSYWYLRHFYLKAMRSYVDWINLMSHDLHRIWGRDNPIKIMDLIKDTNAKPVYDKVAKVNYMAYCDNNWISYDDARTFKDKAVRPECNRWENKFPSNVIALEMNVDTGSEGAGYSSDDASQCRVTDYSGVCSDEERLVGRTNSLDKKKGAVRSLPMPDPSAVHCGLVSTTLNAIGIEEMEVSQAIVLVTLKPEVGMASIAHEVLKSSAVALATCSSIWTSVPGLHAAAPVPTISSTYLKSTRGPAGVEDRIAAGGQPTSVRGNATMARILLTLIQETWEGLLAEVDDRWPLLRCSRRKESAIPSGQLGEGLPTRSTASARLTSSVRTSHL